MPIQDPGTGTARTRKVKRKQPASRSDAAQRTGARTPKPKPVVKVKPKPPTVVAKAQERAYESQGKAVEKQATRQKRVRKRKETRERGKSEAAQGGYRLTPAERAVRDEVIFRARGRVKARARSDAVDKAIKGALRTATFGAGERKGGGSDVPGASVPTTGGGVPAKAARGIGKAFVRNPADTTVNTAKGGRDMLLGIPGAVVEGAVDTYQGTKEGDPLRGVKRAGKEYAADVSRRYGPLMRPGEAGVEKFSKRIEKEGAAAEIAEGVSVGAGVGGAAGRALTVPARAGKLGPKAKRATEPRPKLRESGGEAKSQKRSPNLIVAAGQSARDTARAKTRKRRVQKAKRRDQPVRPLDAAVKEGEVTRIRKGDLTLGTKRQQRKATARAKGRAVQGLKREQAREVGDANRAIAGLKTRTERRAFKYALQLGIRTPEAARKALTRRLEAIEANRAASGVEVPRLLKRTNDEVKTIRWLIDHADEAFTPRLAAVVTREEARSRRAAELDPGVDNVQATLRRYAQQAEHLGIERREGETNGQFVRRVKAAAKAEGLDRPGYFPSQKRPTVLYSNYAAGGTKAVQGPKAYTGRLFREGREDMRPEVHSAGLARNIKRRFNWNLVADQTDTHAFEWGKGDTLEHVKDAVDHEGVDLAEVAFWNPGRFRELQRQHSTTGESERTGSPEDLSPEGLHEAIMDAGVTGDKLSTKPEDFRKQKGWVAIPRAVYDEIMADTRPSGKVGRGWDVVKGKQSRLLLGTSPAWLQFQVASNALLSGFGGAGPKDLVQAQLWWRKLSDEERAAVEPLINVESFADARQQPKIGAAANGSLINSYRAFKDLPLWTKPRKGLHGGAVRDLNPLDFLFRLNKAQDNVFRRAVMYDRVKKDAYRRMGRSTGEAAALQRRLMGLLELDPYRQMKRVVRDKDALERHAQAVTDFLGDYATYTARERRVFSRSVMFYGFLRFSLRFTFYTMPTKHPVITALLANLGRLQTEEVRKILGGDALPWQLGKFYYEKDGQLYSVNVARANPTLNQITQLRDVKDLAGFLPPVVTAALNQVVSKNIFLDRPLRVEGEEEGRRSTDYGLGNRARIFGKQALLDLLTPYKTWEDAASQGRPQGDDSLAFDLRPTEFSDADKMAGVEADAAKFNAGRTVMGQLLPLVPQPDKARESVALNEAYKELNAARDRLERLKRSDDGFFYTRAYETQLDEIKRLETRVNTLQAKGRKVVRKTQRLERRPLSPREEAEKKRDELRSSDPRAELERRIEKRRAALDIQRER